MPKPTEEEKPFKPYIRWDQVYFQIPLETKVDWNNTFYQILADNVLNELQERYSRDKNRPAEML